ncbi:MAG: efflux RND transporter periplasmic adaptor subunit [Deltaproteobacteria bacterium]|nr:efflux RND transporter periplasmic adaptor subunit [Deltaproteobacteria bacterium]
MKIKIILVVFALLVVGIAGYVFYGQRASEEVSYSGTVEATSAALSFQLGGQVVAVDFHEGQQVEKGRVLARLDQREIDFLIEQANANRERASKRSEQTQMALTVARRVIPEELERANAELSAAEMRLANAKSEEGRFLELYNEGLIATREMDQVKLNHDLAKTRFAEAQARVNQAQSNLEKVNISEKEMQESQAALRQMEAALAQTQLKKEYATLYAPFKGTILKKALERGEMVAAGREVANLADLSRVEVKIYVEETRIGKVMHSAPAEVVVDSFPEKKFSGVVSFISSEAEFTPKTIQTPTERVKLVYLVKVLLDNPLGELKPGMLADVYLR